MTRRARHPRAGRSAALALALTFLAMQGAAPDAARHERTLEALRDPDPQRRGAAARRAPRPGGPARELRPARRARSTRCMPPPPRSAERRHGRDRARPAPRSTPGRGGRGGGRARRRSCVEAFKSQNALLQNSLAYFSHLSAAADGARGERAGERHAPLHRRAARRGGAGRCRGPRPARGEPAPRPGSGCAGRPRPADRRLPCRPWTGSSPASLRRRSPRGRDAVQEAYLDFHGRATARADRFRVLLYAAALALVIYLGHLFLRLRANARSLRSRRRLREPDRRDLDGFHRPAARADRRRASMRASPGSGAHTGADRVTIVLAGASRRGARRMRGARASLEPPGLAPEDRAGRRRRTGSCPAMNSQGWIHVPRVAALPEGPAKRQLAQAASRTWLCIPLWRAGDAPRLSRLRLRCASKHWPRDDLALLRTAAEIFANAIERERGEAEREALQDRLAQAQRLEAVGTLAGGIAHEFNNILGVILGAAEMALAAPASEQVRRRLRQITTAAERAQRRRRPGPRLQPPPRARAPHRLRVSRSSPRRSSCSAPRCPPRSRSSARLDAGERRGAGRCRPSCSRW